jgi:hypothetical protein
VTLPSPGAFCAASFLTPFWAAVELFYPLYPLLEKSVRSVAASPPCGVKVGFAAFAQLGLTDKRRHTKKKFNSLSHEKLYGRIGVV